MAAKLFIILIVLFLNSFGLKNNEKVFYAKDRYIEELIVLYADDSTGVEVSLFKDHDWYGKTDFKYTLNGDTLKIDFVDDKNESVVLSVRKNKLKKISYDKSLYFNKYHRISTKKLNRLDFSRDIIQTDL